MNDFRPPIVVKDLADKPFPHDTTKGNGHADADEADTAEVRADLARLFKEAKDAGADRWTHARLLSMTVHWMKYLAKSLREEIADQAKEIRELRAQLAAASRANFDEATRTLTIGSASCKLAIPLYRELYVSRQTYERGDVVTYGGDMWICRATSTTEPPGKSNAWRLSVRHGRDGR